MQLCILNHLTLSAIIVDYRPTSCRNTTSRMTLLDGGTLKRASLQQRKAFSMQACFDRTASPRDRATSIACFFLLHNTELRGLAFYFACTLVTALLHPAHLLLPASYMSHLRFCFRDRITSLRNGSQPQHTNLLSTLPATELSLKSCYNGLLQPFALSCCPVSGLNIFKPC